MCHGDEAGEPSTCFNQNILILVHGALLADKALDKGSLLRDLPVRGTPAGISAKANRKEQHSYDREVYK